MRIAILSDIHGNSIALDAVLADIHTQGGVDQYWVLGDHCALGYDPMGVIKRLQALPNATFTYGNSEQYILSGEYPHPKMPDVEQNIAHLKVYGEVQRSFAWTQGALVGAGQYDWIANLPLDVRLTLPDGTRLLGVHAAPGIVDGENFCDAYALDDMEARLVGADADLVIVGHMHWPYNHQFKRSRVIVTGGIGNPFAADMRAKYVILEADEAGYTITFRYVAYDYEAVVAAIEASHHASAEFLLLFARAQYVPPWFVGYSADDLRAVMPKENHPYRYSSRNGISVGQ